MGVPAALLEELQLTETDIAAMDAEEAREVLRLLYERTRELAAESLQAFVHHVNPKFIEGRHHSLICDRLERLERGEITRLMIFMPPRSSKSFLSSIHFPAWWLGRNPTAHLMGISYSSDMVNTWGRAVRNLVSSREYSEVFSETRISPDERSASIWSTTSGGFYFGAGIKAGIAGRGASLAIVDDPLNEQDAFSAAAIRHVESWYPGGLVSRLMPAGRILVTSTRWVLDDLPGQLLRKAEVDENADQWEVLKIPALLTEEASRLMGWTPEMGPGADYAPNTTYWPPHPNPPAGVELSGWSTSKLQQIKNNMPTERWVSLYQQEPIPEGGAIFKAQYINNWEQPDPPDCSYLIQSVDTAFSEKTRADYTAMTFWGIFKHEGKPRMILLGARRGKWAFGEMKDKVIEGFHRHRPDTILVENKASGPSLISELRQAGLPVTEYPPPGTRLEDKLQRAHASTGYVYDGGLWLPLHKPWAQDVFRELVNFQGVGVEDDDYVDTTTQAILWSRGGQLVMTTDDLNLGGTGGIKPKGKLY